MKYQQAKLMLMEKKPAVHLSAYAVEAAVMVGIAAILVQLFA